MAQSSWSSTFFRASWEGVRGVAIVYTTNLERLAGPGCDEQLIVYIYSHLPMLNLGQWKARACVRTIHLSRLDIS